MAALKAIKNKIRSIEKTQKVTKAMEAVSAAKMRKAQAAAVASRAYARAATSILARLSGTRQAAYMELAAVRPVHRALYIVITSDKGLAGALNSAVLRATSADIAKSGLPNSAVSVIAVGRKANDYFTTRGIEVLQYYPNTDDIHNGAMEAILNTARVRFELSSAGEGAADTVKIAYQNFISTFEQRPTLRTIFPLSLDELQKVVSDIVPARGAFAQAVTEVAQPNAYSIEPSEEEVLAAIIPLLAGIFLYHALLESQASEHSARMVSMKAASDNAATLTDTLTIKFNKARQASITQEISEITGGLIAQQA
jgi:F-type H+-transporting ATPase subunit gamma